MLTKALAMEWSHYGILVNSLFQDSSSKSICWQDMQNVLKQSSVPI